jgi:hypothetical protein
LRSVASNMLHHALRSFQSTDKINNIEELRRRLSRLGLVVLLSQVTNVQPERHLTRADLVTTTAFDLLSCIAMENSTTVSVVQYTY